MCGILVHVRRDDAELPESLMAAVESMAHRGPDAQQTSSRDGVFLGHRRLKILDLGDQANQPMCSDDGRYALVYNGEIYNYLELRDDLQARGYRFRTSGDTEVLLYAYAEYGAQCLERLNGMFAFAIYDYQARECFVARDRSGIKPLFYHWDGKAFSAASELRAIIATDPRLRQINPKALAQYLMMGSVQAPETIFAGVTALLPGHWMLLSGWALEIRRYWAPPFVPESEKAPTSPDEAAAHTRSLLMDSVQKQLISDVPLGAFLSGGFDSSVVVGIMSSVSSLPINTFSIGFDVGGAAYNENQTAEVTAAQFGCRHRTCLVSGADVIAELPRFIHHLDQPTCDGFNSYFVSKFAREHVTVALSGLGGDEIFAGYRRARYMHIINRIRRWTPKLPRQLARRLEQFAGTLSPSTPKLKQVNALASCFGAWPTNAEIYLLLMWYFSREQVARLLGLADRSFSDDICDVLKPGEALGAIDAACYFDQSIYMGNRLLRDTDVMSMAHSLEVRVPFLDHRLIEYVAALPEACKYSPGTTKPLLANAFKDILPPHVLHRKKMGFSFPLNIWMQEPGFKEIMLDCLSPRGLLGRGLLDSQISSRIVDTCLKADVTKPYSYEGDLLYLLTVLELWLRDLDRTEPQRGLSGYTTNASSIAR